MQFEKAELAPGKVRGARQIFPRGMRATCFENNFHFSQKNFARLDNMN